MKKWVLIVLLFSCGVQQPKYDATDKVLIGINLSLQAMDTHSTVQGLKGGAIETNPIYGKHPSTGTIVATKIVAVSLMYLLTNKMGSTERKTFFILTGLLYAFVVTNNYMVQR